VARGVYEVTIPAQSDDFEYYIEAQTPIGNATYPVTAPAINQTVVVLTFGGPPDCPVGDLNDDCYVDANDLRLFAAQWLDDPCCPGHPNDCADLDGQNDGVDFEDYSYLAGNWHQPDRNPPVPNPATWETVPATLGHDSITMTATAGSDPSGPLQYFFDETSGNPGGSDSGWQTSTSYIDFGLSPSTQYTYTVQMRDSVPNIGTASSPANATTQAASDTTPPTPNPATWASAPSADSSSAISMTANTGSDSSGPVQYYFDETSDNPGGSDSGWQTSASYTDTGLTASTQYTYTVQMRDSVPNTGTASSPANATTTAGGETWQKVDDRNASVTLYGSDWILGDGWIPGVYQNTLSISASSGNYAIYSFTGTKVRLYAAKADDGGTADISIDSVPDGTVNFFDLSDLGDVLVYESGTLSSGSHELRVDWTSSTRIYLDAFEFYGP
jgi:hypothetical protein